MKSSIIKHFKLKHNISDEDILKKIHLNKNKKNQLIVKKYLTAMFVKNKDIRYFNEFLWVSKNKKFLEKNYKIFQENFYNNTFKYNYTKKLKYCLNLKNTKVKLNTNIIKKHSIALIGNPIFFILPYLYFRIKNIKIEIINIKYHQNKIIFFIFYNFIFDFIYKIIFFKNYKVIKIKDKNEIKHIKLGKVYDIGFHKLNFIIPKNIYKSFSKGLINDHWGPLPLFRGRSTLEYAKLFGAKLIITNHTITNNIDQGKIILYTKLNEIFPYFDIYFKISKRIVSSINQLSLNKFEKTESLNGIYFYKMHKWLKNQIN